MKKALFFSFAILCVIAIQSCCKMSSSHSLGNGFALLEGDKLKDNAIIFCPPQNKCCNGGAYVLPTYENHYDNEGQYVEYIESAESNKNWIIVKSILVKDKSPRFWIIDKKFILDSRYEDWPLSEEDGRLFSEFIKSRIAGPFDFESFNNRLQELNIDINLSD